MATYNPTGLLLPQLIYDGKTRVAGEVHLYYNLTLAHVFGSIGIDGDGNEVYEPEASCGPSTDIPVSNIGAVRIRKPIKSGTDSFWGIGGGNTAQIPMYAPADQAAELGSIGSSVLQGSVVVTGASPGDSAEVIALPNPAGDVLICYDAGLDWDTGVEDKPIPRKFKNADHYVRQRGERTLTVKDMYVNNLVGFAGLRNRDFTLIAKIFPDDGAIPSEIIYFTGARLNVPRTIPEDANESITVNATGNYKEALIFSARPV